MSGHIPAWIGPTLAALALLWIARLIAIKEIGLKQLGAIGLGTVSLMCLCSLLNAVSIGIIIVSASILIWLVVITFGGDLKLK
jgi:hypothetical protein